MYRYWARPGPTCLPDSQSSLTERLISQYLQNSGRTTGRPRISPEFWPNDRQTKNIFRNLAKRPNGRDLCILGRLTNGRDLCILGRLTSGRNLWRLNWDGRRPHLFGRWPILTMRLWPTAEPYYDLSLIHIWRCRRIERCRSRWSPSH